MSDKPEKLDLNSMDIAAENRARLKTLFPSVFTETVNDKGELVESIDFEKLKSELGTFSDLFESRRERFGLDWPGKKDCIKLIQEPSRATLKPARDESIDFDTTENLFIEGENLEVLKLLQKSYYGKVKMIYIDPPYNTGKEFIYPDKYSESLETYLEYAGLVDSKGRKFSTNTPNEGRFHTKWLNMMYPRLYLARNLLREDGVIFIQIDDGEQAILKRLCDELFGEENYINTISVNMKNVAGASGGGEDKRLKKNIEYIHVYAKNYYIFPSFKKIYDLILIADLLQHYREEGKSWKYTSVLFNSGDKEYVGSTLDGDGNEIKIFKRNNYVIKSVGQLIKEENLTEPEVYNRYYGRIFQTAMPQSSIRPRVMRRINELNVTGDLFSIEYVPQSGKNKGKIYEQFYKGNNFRLFAWLKDVSEQIDGKVYKKELKGTYWDFVSETKNLTKEGDVPLQNGKKPVSLLKSILKMQEGHDFIVIDFFAGSCTTAHAVFDLNKEDGGNRKFIMVQLPEPCDEKSEAFKAGYRTIADIGKERIRRVIKKIEEERAAKAKESASMLPGMAEEMPEIDLGFKVFKLDKSNFKPWEKLDADASEEEISKAIQQHLFHIDPGASQEDILYEILLKAGFMPTEKIEILHLEDGCLRTGEKSFAPKVYSIAEGALLICLEDKITRELIDAVCDAEPMQFICLDQGFKGNDQLKTNAVQTFAARNQGRDKAGQIMFRTV